MTSRWWAKRARRAALDSLAHAKAEGALPHVVLMDLLMEPMDGITATAAIKEGYPDVEVVSVTSFIEEERVHAALTAGSAGYSLKEAEADEVAAAVRSARRGEVDLDLGERLELAIVDDGEGFDTRREHPDHLGLRTMQERTQAIAGTLEVQSEPGRGTTVPLVIG